MKLRRKTINEIADMICGNFEEPQTYFVYRSSSFLTEFFEDCDLEYFHDGSTRKWWVADVLAELLSDPSSHPHLLPDSFIVVIRRLMDPADVTNEDSNRAEALKLLNSSLSRDGFCAYYDDSGICQVRNTETRATSSAIRSPQRAWTKEELENRQLIAGFLDSSSENQITEEILLPLFRQLGFQRITATDHKDKALEYGKDIWMKYRLPTQHDLYFGIQVKKGTIDSSGRTNESNIAGLLSQIQMLLGHPIFDPEINKKRLVDHAIIISGGEITKQARNWLGERLHASQRSQILFMERNDILDLLLTNQVPLPKSIEDGNKPPNYFPDDALPF